MSDDATGAAPLVNAARGRRSALGALAVIGVLLALVGARRLFGLGGWGGVVPGLVVSGLCVAIARHAGASWDDLGCARERWRDGARWGGTAFAAVVAGVAVVAVLPFTSGLLEDDRAQLSGWQLLGTVAVVIPLGTVLPEEVAFRGSLLALGEQAWGRRAAVLVSSIAFGVWHVPPTLRTMGGNAAADGLTSSSLGRAAFVTGMVVAMAAAGAVLCWFRTRSGSLLAPVLVHVATNTVALTAAWIVSSA